MERRRNELKGPGDAILILDRDLRIVDINQDALTLFPFSGKNGKPLSRDLIVGRKLSGLAKSNRFCVLQHALQKWSRDRDSSACGQYECEGRWVEIQAYAVSVPESGSIIIARDVTDQRTAQDALQQSSSIVHLLQSVAIAANESESWLGILRSTVDYICNYSEWAFGHVYVPAKANPGEMKSTTLWHLKPELPQPREEVIHELTKISLAADLPRRVIDGFHALWLEDISQDREFLKAGLPNPMGVRAAFAFPVRLDGRLVAVLEFFALKALPSDLFLIEVSGNIADQIVRVLERENSQRIISEQQLKIAESTKLSALGEMAGGIAHEINNPLAAIHTLSGQLKELAETNHLNPQLVSKIANTVEATSMRIAKIVKGLRAFARDGQKDPFEKVSVKTIVEETLVFCTQKLGAAGVEFTFEDFSGGAQVACRAVQISQVLLNLINNAYDAISQKEERWIRVEMLDSGPDVVIAVTDSGAGIPYDVQERMFSPFYTTKEVGKGTGMGLSISKAIMEDHGGELSFDPTYDHTRFLIRIPKDEAQRRSEAA